MTLRQRLKSSVFNDDILSTFYKEREKKKPKVCFLSSKGRDAAGHSRFECEYKTDARDVGPSSYNIEKQTSAFSQILGKVGSNVGYGGLASKAPRFVYPPTEMVLSPPKRLTKSNRKSTYKMVRKIPKPPPPFGSAIPRQTGTFGKKEDTPGFYYDITRAFRKRQMDFEHCFGGQMKMKPHVLWKCTPDNTDTCAMCHKKPHGDYFISGSNALCLYCFDVEWNKPSKFSRKQLNTFQAIRDCSDIHDHGGTTAAVPLVSNSDIRKQRVLENYFASFASPRKVTKATKVTRPKCQFIKSNENKLTVLFENKHRQTF